MSIIYQGADALIKVEMPLDVDDYDNILITVFDYNRRVITRASKVAETGYDTDLFMTDPVDDKVCYCQVLAEHTLNARPGEYFCEVWSIEPDGSWKTLEFNDKAVASVFTLKQTSQKTDAVS